MKYLLYVIFYTLLFCDLSYAVDNTFSVMAKRDYSCVDSYKELYGLGREGVVCNVPLKNSVVHRNQSLIIFNEGMSLAKKYRLSSGNNNAYVKYKLLRFVYKNEALADVLYDYIKSRYVSYVKNNKDKVNINKSLMLEKLRYFNFSEKDILDMVGDSYNSKYNPDHDYNNYLSFYKNKINIDYLHDYVSSNKKSFYSLISLSKYYFERDDYSSLEGLLSNITKDNKSYRLISAYRHVLNNDNSFAINDLSTINYQDEDWSVLKEIPLSLIAVLHLEKGDFTSSLKYYKSLIYIDKSNMNYWLGFAISAENLNKNNSAKKAYSYILRYDKNKDAVFYARSKLSKIM